MAHVILFTDRAPKSWSFDKFNLDSEYVTYSSGAYKVASHLRGLGYKVLVVPNCLRFSFSGVKKIIEQNSKELLWVGISTTFLMMRDNGMAYYRELWHDSVSPIIDNQSLFKKIDTWQASTELVWNTGELNRIADHLESNYQVPLLIGGAWVSRIQGGNFQRNSNNLHIVTGYAEKFVEDFTRKRSQDRSAEPMYLVDNKTYDDVEFKKSMILYEATDIIDPNMALPVEVSRGCAFNCAYCDFPRKSTFDSFKDPDTLRNELIRNYEMFGVTKFLLVDELYNDSVEKVEILHDKVWTKLPFQPEWSTYMRLDMFWAAPHTIDLVKNSGARLGSFGIETMHDKAGRKVGKGLGKSRILETLHMLKEKWGTDVIVNANMIAGLPQEPLDHIRETMEWIDNTDLIHSYQYNPLWVSPPEHDAFVKIKNPMSHDYDKYGIKWISPGIWQNELGITFKDVDLLVKEKLNKRRSAVRVGFGDYADFRHIGLNHEDLVKICFRGTNGFDDLENFEDVMRWCAQRTREIVDDRVNQVLNIMDE
jgi:radical SAM superfamily enzyme YgiQ (UPF0313 family)